MGHGHDHGPVTFNRMFLVGVTLNVVYVAVEAGFGLWSGSVALLADAGHNLSDVVGLLLAWGAHHLAGRSPSPNRTYGWGSSSILAAVLNGLLLLVAVVAIGWEAIGRFREPVQPIGLVMIVVAGVGVVINSITAWLFFADRTHDLNIRGAYLHMAADAVVSLGVVISGLILLFLPIYWIDPVIALIIAGLILWSTWGLLRESIHLLLHGVPAEIDIGQIESTLIAQSGVQSLHCLHVWAISTTQAALTVHLVCPDGLSDDTFLSNLRQVLHDEHDIEHMTVQIESQPCPQCHPDFDWVSNENCCEEHLAEPEPSVTLLTEEQT